jgi:hypothetical protein
LAREGLGIVAAFATLHSDNKQALSKRKEVCACLRRDDNYTVGNGGD